MYAAPPTPHESDKEAPSNRKPYIVFVDDERMDDSESEVSEGYNSVNDGLEEDDQASIADTKPFTEAQVEAVAKLNELFRDANEWTNSHILSISPTVSSAFKDIGLELRGVGTKSDDQRRSEFHQRQREADSKTIETLRTENQRLASRASKLEDSNASLIAQLQAHEAKEIGMQFQIAALSETLKENSKRFAEYLTTNDDAVFDRKAPRRHGLDSHRQLSTDTSDMSDVLKKISELMSSKE